ncbi:hypothetical protein MH215_03850 [Paenibacillus sp. ACRSA]|uniref:hypothetical protein n=1 Tax=Paenibacillus sp. ACRSA TaxID=2918211 RepID=UPI001EF5ED9E|nr:hypothetical protein [Paenibacillus sp. ACRSA]MCG7376112.1 hypothetical protein [Paenibacillus sp. ACRSA]
MLSLEPERLDYRISTTEMEVRYTEQNGVNINVDVTPLEESGEMKYHQMQLNFSNVAELRCITLNFYEANYDAYELIGTNPDTGVYQVYTSEWLVQERGKYDPRNRLQLRHYIVVGYDSYVELLASTYTVDIQ